MFGRALISRAGTAALQNGPARTMPLKAKIIHPAFTNRPLSPAMTTPTASTSVTPYTTDSKAAETSPRRRSTSLTQTEPLEVAVRSNYGVRVLELNRPAKLHSLNRSMIARIQPTLQEWVKSDMANVVILTASGHKAFCAGGDVAAIAQLDLTSDEGFAQAMEYFTAEYDLDHYIATYPKPLIVHLDGITMGGGAGLTMHAPIRIATENTVWAMPETTIGFFPDVGASFFLSRLPGSLGTYLALSSEQIKGANAFYTGIATHYMHSATLPMLEERLAELRFNDYDSLQRRLGLITATINEYNTGLPHNEPPHFVGRIRQAIDRCFKHQTIPEIIKALEEEKDNMRDWADSTIQTLQMKSPTSLAVTLRQLVLARRWSISQALHREHQLAAKFMRLPDFKEGVSAQLIRKDRKPRWQPASVEEVQDVNSFFEIDPDLKINFTSKEDYREYPFKFGVPREQDVERMIKAEPWNRGRITKELLKMSSHLPGVELIVQDILDRKTKTLKDGLLTWRDG